MNPFSRSNLIKDTELDVAGTFAENFVTKDNFAVLRFGEIVCTVKGFNKIPALLQDPNLSVRQDALWILTKVLTNIETTSKNSNLRDLNIIALTDLLRGRLSDMDLESGFLSLKALSSLVKWDHSLDEEKAINLSENLTTFMNNLESFQFKCLELAVNLFQNLQSRIREVSEQFICIFENKNLQDRQLPFGETFSRRLLDLGEHIKKSSSVDFKAGAYFLTLINENFHFIESLDLFANTKFIKIVCEYLVSSQLEERSLALQAIFKLSKNKVHSKLLVDNLSMKHVYKALQADDRTTEILTNILFNLCQHKKVLQEKIAKYPGSLRTLVQYFEKLLENIDEDRDAIITLTKLLADLAEYPLIRAQITQYGIYSILSKTKKAFRNNIVKEEIFKLIDRLASTYQDYEIIFQRGIIDFISQDIAYQNEDLIERFIDFMIKATNSQYLSKDNLGVENALNLEDIVKKTRNVKLRHKIDDLNLLLDREKTPKNQNPTAEVKTNSNYEVNSEKVKYQQILNFKIESLVNHVAKKQNIKKTDALVENMISNLDMQLKTVSLPNNPFFKTREDYTQRSPGRENYGISKKKYALNPNQPEDFGTKSSTYQNYYPDSQAAIPSDAEIRSSKQSLINENKSYYPQEKSSNHPRFEPTVPNKDKVVILPNRGQKISNPDEKIFADDISPIDLDRRSSGTGFHRKLQSLSGNSRPVKNANPDYSFIPSENRMNNLPPRNQSGERKKSSSRNMYPSKKILKNQQLENRNNLSSIEPYRPEDFDNKLLDQNVMNQSFDRPYPEENYYIDEPPVYDRRENIKLPAISSNTGLANKPKDSYPAQESGKTSGQDKKSAVLPKVESFPFSEVEGIDQLIAAKYLEVDFTNVKLKSSKMLRHYLKLGVPEAKGIFNITGASTVESLIMWFSHQIFQTDVLEVVKYLQTAIGSPSRTAFLVCVIVSLGEKQGVSFEKFRNDPRIIME